MIVEAHVEMQVPQNHRSWDCWVTTWKKAAQSVPWTCNGLCKSEILNSVAVSHGDFGVVSYHGMINAASLGQNESVKWPSR